MVDYVGVADQLKKALVTYTESVGQGGLALSPALLPWLHGIVSR